MAAVLVLFNVWQLDYTQIPASVVCNIGGLISRGGTGVEGRALDFDALLRFTFVYIPPPGSANTFYFAGMMGVPVQFAGFGSPLPPSTTAQVSMRGTDGGDWKRRQKKRDEERRAGRVEALEEYFDFTHGA